MEPELAFLGLDAAEEEMYRFLLREGECGREQLATALGGDPRRVRDVCQRMIGRGLARETAGGMLRPLSPAKAVESLVASEVARVKSDLEEQVDAHAVVDSLLTEQAMLHAKPVGESVRRVRGMDAVRGVIDELTFFTWTESLTTIPTGVMSAESIAHARPLDERILRRGVHMRTLLGPAALDDPRTMEYAQELTAKGASIRISGTSVERLIICDRTAALTPIDPADSAQGAILVRESGLVAALVSLFEHMWRAARELNMAEDAARLADRVTPMERRVLASLYASEKDEAGARELGIAVRTYRKHVASLMQRLGAANRFQAALLARDRGWI